MCEYLSLSDVPFQYIGPNNFLKQVYATILMQAELTRQQNEFKIKLKELEDSLLSRLSSAGGNFLGDTALVENLEITKRTAHEIEQKVCLSFPLSIWARGVIDLYFSLHTCMFTFI